MNIYNIETIIILILLSILYGVFSAPSYYAGYPGGERGNRGGNTSLFWLILILGVFIYLFVKPPAEGNGTLQNTNHKDGIQTPRTLILEDTIENEQVNDDSVESNNSFELDSNINFVIQISANKNDTWITEFHIHSILVWYDGEWYRTVIYGFITEEDAQSYIEDFEVEGDIKHIAKYKKSTIYKWQKRRDSIYNKKPPSPPSTIEI